jgi:hypothetical protein
MNCCESIRMSTRINMMVWWHTTDAAQLGATSIYSASQTVVEASANQRCQWQSCWFLSGIWSTP